MSAASGSSFEAPCSAQTWCQKRYRVPLAHRKATCQNFLQDTHIPPKTVNRLRHFGIIARTLVNWALMLWNTTSEWMPTASAYPSPWDVSTLSFQWSNYWLHLGFRTGIPRVGFSHTAPVPVYTVTCGGLDPYRTVTYVVLWKLLLFRHHVSPRVTFMLMDLIPYALCHMLYPFTLCLSFYLISIVIPNVICLLIPHSELHRFHAYRSITHLWLHPQLRSTTAHYAPFTLLVSYLSFRFIYIPHLIIQSDGTISLYLV